MAVKRDAPANGKAQANKRSKPNEKSAKKQTTSKENTAADSEFSDDTKTKTTTRAKKAALYTTVTTFVREKLPSTFRNGDVYVELRSGDPKRSYFVDQKALGCFSSTLGALLITKPQEAAHQRTLDKIKKERGITSFLNLTFCAKSKLWKLTIVPLTSTIPQDPIQRFPREVHKIIRIEIEDDEEITRPDSSTSDLEEAPDPELREPIASRKRRSTFKVPHSGSTKAPMIEISSYKTANKINDKKIDQASIFGNRKDVQSKPETSDVAFDAELKPTFDMTLTISPQETSTSSNAAVKAFEVHEASEIKSSAPIVGVLTQSPLISSEAGPDDKPAQSDQHHFSQVLPVNVTDQMDTESGSFKPPETNDNFVESVLEPALCGIVNNKTDKLLRSPSPTSRVVDNQIDSVDIEYKALKTEHDQLNSAKGGEEWEVDESGETSCEKSIIDGVPRATTENSDGNIMINSQNEAMKSRGNSHPEAQKPPLSQPVTQDGVMVKLDSDENPRAVKEPVNYELGMDGGSDFIEISHATAVRKSRKTPGITASKELAIEAHHQLLCCMINLPLYPPYKDIQATLEVSEYLIRLSREYVCLNQVRLFLQSHLCNFGQTLYRAIAAEPWRWLTLAIDLQSSPIFKEAIIHLVGLSIHKPITKLPNMEFSSATNILILKKRSELEALQRTATLKMYGIDTNAYEERRMHPLHSNGTICIIWVAIQLWHDWFRTETNARSSQNIPMAKFYRRIAEGNNAYLSDEVVIDQLTKFGKPELLDCSCPIGLREGLQRMKESAREKVQLLVVNNSAINLDKFLLGHFTCTEVRDDEVPWFTHLDGDGKGGGEPGPE